MAVLPTGAGAKKTQRNRKSLWTMESKNVFEEKKNKVFKKYKENVYYEKKLWTGFKFSVYQSTLNFVKNLY